MRMQLRTKIAGYNDIYSKLTHRCSLLTHIALLEKKSMPNG